MKFSRMLAYHAELEHNNAQFADFIFAYVRSTMKSAKILSNEISHYTV